jgi:hypothetical protein
LTRFAGFPALLSQKLKPGKLAALKHAWFLDVSALRCSARQEGVVCLALALSYLSVFCPYENFIEKPTLKL